jgi:hypothetical protein
MRWLYFSLGLVGSSALILAAKGERGKRIRGESENAIWKSRLRSSENRGKANQGRETMTYTPQQRIRIMEAFINRLCRNTGNATAGVWVDLHREAGVILLEHLPALEAELPPDQPELELAEARDVLV